jgi:ankyrin repeat protein
MRKMCLFVPMRLYATLCSWSIGVWDEEESSCFTFFVGPHTTALFNRVMNRFNAAENGNLHVLRGLLTTNNVDDADGFGWTALSHAAGKGKMDCVRYCLEMGANVMARSANGWTPLHVASYFGSVDVVHVFLDAGATVDEKDNAGFSPLCCAIQSSEYACAKLLIDRGTKMSSIKVNNSFLRAIPDWVTAFVESRSNCRTAAIVMVGIHKYRRTTVSGNNDINVLRLIGKHIWSMRMGYI